MDELEQPIPRGLKVTFSLHLVIAGSVGLQHLLVPTWWTDFAGIPVDDTGLWRLIGSATASLPPISSWSRHEVDETDINVLKVVIRRQGPIRRRPYSRTSDGVLRESERSAPPGS